MAFYRGEQYDPDLGLYYLRARYYNPVTGRFLNVDPMAGQGQRRYEYAGADPVDNADPSGNFILESYWPLCCAAAAIPSLNFHWCSQGSVGLFDSFFPPCSPHHKTVKVGWRSLLKDEYPKERSAKHHFYPLFFFHHTYIEIDNDLDGSDHTWGVLGGPDDAKPIVKQDQEVVRDDPRNGPAGWSGTTIVPATDSEAETLENTLRTSEFVSGSVCPSCATSYHNWWYRVPPDGYNSNTYTWNMIYNWGKTPPSTPALSSPWSPGYHYSSGYDHYYSY
jgi:RHS repeat-associated protein